MIRIFINGLREGNGLEDPKLRIGSLIGVFEIDQNGNPVDKGNYLASGVSDPRGVFERHIPDFEGSKNVRIVFRDRGFKYFHVDTTLNNEGFFYTAKLEVDHVYQGSGTASAAGWNTEAKYEAALQQLIKIARDENQASEQTEDRIKALEESKSFSDPDKFNRKWIPRMQAIISIILVVFGIYLLLQDINATMTLSIPIGDRQIKMDRAPYGIISIIIGYYLFPKSYWQKP